MTSRASRALFALVLLLGACFASLPGAAGAMVSARPKADDAPAVATPDVTVALLKLDPLVPTGIPSQALALSGTFQNMTKGPLTDVSIQLGLVFVKSRSGLTTDPPQFKHVSLESAKLPKPVATVAAGADAAWAFPAGLTMADIGLTDTKAAGVYALDVRVVSSDDDVLGSTRTYLAWKPLSTAGDVSTSQALVAVVWPVVGPPAIDGVVSSGTKAPQVFNADLTNEIAPGGRLDTVVKQGASLGENKVNWAVDPDIYTSVVALGGSAGYQLPGNPPTAATSTDVSNAVTWMYTAQQAITTANCWRLPDADPDLAGLAHAGAAGVTLATRAQNQTSATGNCGAEPNVQTLAWPGDGYADKTTIDLIHAAGLGTALLSGAKDSIQMPTKGDTVTPSGHAYVTGSKGIQVNAYVTVPELDQLFTQDMQNPKDKSTPGLLAGQKWLAQTALIAREGTFPGRTLVAVPPRDFLPTQGMIDALKAAEHAPWTGLTSLGSPALQTKVSQTPTPTAPDNRPASIAKDDIPPKAVGLAADNDALMQSFLAIQTRGDRDASSPLRSVATYWRGKTDAQAAYAKAADTQAADLHSQVRIASSSNVTLSGKSGKVPVTIVNNLSNDVSVQLKATSGNGTVVTIEDASKQQSIIVPAYTQKPVTISMRIAGNGQAVPIDLQLLTPATGPDANAPYSAVTSINVKVSRIGFISLALLFGSAAVIIVGIGLRVLRANRAHHAAGQDTMAS